MFFPSTKKGKANFLTPLVLGIIIYSLYNGYYYKKNIDYPYINFDRNKVYIYSVKRTNSLLDTLSILQKSESYLRKLNSPLIREIENNDSVVGKYYFHGNFFIQECNSIPYFSAFDTSNQVYTITLLKSPIKINTIWKDDNTGLVHEYLKYDSLIIENNLTKCLLVKTELSLKSRKLILHNLKEVNLNEDKKLRLISILKKPWLKWYAPKIGLVKEIYPDGSEWNLLKIKDIYWFERIVRYFGFGVY